VLRSVEDLDYTLSSLDIFGVISKLVASLPSELLVRARVLGPQSLLPLFGAVMRGVGLTLVLATQHTVPAIKVGWDFASSLFMLFPSSAIYCFDISRGYILMSLLVLVITCYFDGFPFGSFRFLRVTFLLSSTSS